MTDPVTWHVWLHNLVCDGVSVSSRFSVMAEELVSAASVSVRNLRLA